VSVSRTVRVLCFVPLVFVLSVSAQAQTTASADDSSAPAPAAVNPAPVQKLFGAFPVATASADARKFIEQAFDKYENVQLEDATDLARQATQKDPNFALGFATLSFITRRGTPDTKALARAKSLLPRAASEEQLLVRWMTSVQESDLVPAISLMNDLLVRYPKDRHILYLTAEWLYFQQDYDRSREMFERILKISPDYPPALNMLGYAYIETGVPQPQKAIDSLKRYAEVNPTSPNPEDSLGEVSRYAGQDEQSLEHYSHALKIDPTFITSRIGLGDTYTLMSKYDAARAEYDKALKISTNARDTLHAKYQKALTYFWEGKSAQGLETLQNLAAEATQQKDPYAQFEIDFARALLTPQVAGQLAQLETLESQFSRQQPGMIESDRNDDLAAILRQQARLHSAAKHFEQAQAAVAKLERLAGATRDLIVENCYESAEGYLSLAQGNLESAADGLSADPQSPLVIFDLTQLQEKLGDASAESTKNRLKYLRAPTLEWFLVTHSAAAPAS